MLGKIYQVCRAVNPLTGRRDGEWQCPCDGFKYRHTCSHVRGLHNEASIRQQYPIPAYAYEPVGVAAVAVADTARDMGVPVTVSQCRGCGDALPVAADYSYCVNCDFY